MPGRDKNDASSMVGAQAAKWFLRLRDGELNEGDRRRYLDWLKASPTHVAEMVRIEQLHGMLKNMMLDPN